MANLWAWEFDLNGLWDHLPVCDRVASQLIGDNLLGFASMITQQAVEEPLSCCAITLGL